MTSRTPRSRRAPRARPRRRTGAVGLSCSRCRCSPRHRRAASAPGPRTRCSAAPGRAAAAGKGAKGGGDRARRAAHDRAEPEGQQAGQRHVEGAGQHGPQHAGLGQRGCRVRAAQQVLAEKNAAKLATSAMTSVTAASTAAFAPNSTPRLGITASDVRIMPVPYSDVITMAPRTTMTSWPISPSPTRLVCVGSNPA